MNADWPSALAVAPEPPSVPLAEAVAALGEIVGDSRIRVAVHGVPLAIFARDDVKHQQTLANEDGSAFVTAEIAIGSHTFSIYSAIFGTETPKDEPTA